MEVNSLEAKCRALAAMKWPDGMTATWRDKNHTENCGYPSLKISNKADCSVVVLDCGEDDLGNSAFIMWTVELFREEHFKASQFDPDKGAPPAYQVLIDLLNRPIMFLTAEFCIDSLMAWLEVREG